MYSRLVKRSAVRSEKTTSHRSVLMRTHTHDVCNTVKIDGRQVLRQKLW